MPKATTTIGDVLNKIFKATALPWDAETNLAIHLHTASPGVGGTTATNEATYTSYAKVTVSRSGTGWTVAGGVSQNAALIQFPQCTGGTNTITHVSISPDSTTQILYFGSLNSPLSVSNLIQPQFSAGALQVTES